MPVGFKNGTDGGLQVALHAMISARHPHTFLGISADGATAMIKTAGNPDRHVVLRGGGSGPNYSPADVARAAEMVAGEDLARPVMIDCSHGNSSKDYTRQPIVCREVLSQLARQQRRDHGPAGREQPAARPPGLGARARRSRYGVSITDACIGWDETETLLGEIAAAARTKTAARRRRRLALEGRRALRGRPSPLSAGGDCPSSRGSARPPARDRLRRRRARAATRSRARAAADRRARTDPGRRRDRLRPCGGAAPHRSA